MARILIIDDEPMVRDLLVKFLGLKHDVLAASTASEGVESLETGWDLVIADLNLPDASGTEVVHRIREKDREVPLLTITGGPLDQSVMESLESAGGANSLAKPFSLVSLQDRVEDAIG